MGKVKSQKEKAELQWKVIKWAIGLNNIRAKFSFRTNLLSNPVGSKKVIPFFFSFSEKL